jgi:hypothetical protein
MIEARKKNMQKSAAHNVISNVIVRKIAALLQCLVVDLNLCKTVVEHQDSSYSYNPNPDDDNTPFSKRVKE